MKWLTAAVAALALCLLLYAGSALASLARLAEAARRGDAEQVLARTDLPRVRHALVDQLVDAYLRRLGRERPIKPLERLAINTFGASIADELAAKLMTRENIAVLLQTGALPENVELGTIPPLASIDLSNMTAIMGRLALIKPVEFSLQLGAAADAGSISMHFAGDGWRLSAVNLPARMVAKLVERLPTR
ncbi:DUF2939 domain-containing protein [Bradyrhizobium sp. BR 10289]|uniref:DUF2939 domain-containing protein n=1 Tax=Bradyrhizobium sp. BR 10289 TaxID=2749993 RepID=UPI001C6473E7|nr:DUF2939 domain-containing protein [Bradyrhizobium sp. BR 10289]MBW7974097.1 DUF2939 domain-containing protein [Bradyrhizobium sp. BR 10289]